jgi:phage portal protein BeeE
MGLGSDGGWSPFTVESREIKQATAANANDLEFLRIGESFTATFQGGRKHTSHAASLLNT